MEIPPTEPGTTNVIIGTRHWLGPNWTHIDIDAAPLSPMPGLPPGRYPVDVVCDAKKLTLPDGCADLVFSSEALEHFPWRDYQAVLAEWARIVRPGGGRLWIEVPDFLLACQEVIAYDSLDGDRRMQQIIFGGQDNPFDFHFAGITHRMLADDLQRLGFDIESVERGNECGWLRVIGRRP